MALSPIASAEVHRVYRVIGRYQGVLRKGAPNYPACMLNFTGRLHWNWPRSRGHDLPGVMCPFERRRIRVAYW